MSSKSITDKSQRLSWGVLLAIFMLGMGLRLYRLDARSLWGDEVYSAKRVRLDLRSMVDKTATDDDIPPLFYTITHLSIIFLSDSDFIFRLPTALFGSLSILLAYKAGETLWTRKEGLMGAFLLAVNPYHVQFSQYARHFALTGFLTLLSLIFLLKALETNKKSLWIGFALSTTLSIYNHYFAFLPLTSQGILVAWVIAEGWLSDREPAEYMEGIHISARLSTPAKQALMFAFSLAMAGLLFLPWLSAMLHQISGPHVAWEGFGSAMTVGAEVLVDYFHLWLSSYSGVDAPLSLLYLGLFVLGLAACKGKHVLLIALWVVMPLIFSLAVRARITPDPRYTLFAVPIYLLVIARGLRFVTRLLHRALGHTEDGRRSLLLLIPCSTALLFGVASLPGLRDHYRWPGEDWRGAAQYVGDRMLPGDIALSDGRDYGRARDHGRVIEALSRYPRSSGVTDVPIYGVKRGLWRDLHGIEPGHGRVSVVLWYRDRPASWETMPGIAVVDFEEVPVIHLREPSGDVLQDTLSMLQVLLRLLPPEARFDVHMALAEIYSGTGRDAQAAFQVELARWVKPDHEGACIDLGDAYLEQGHLEEAANEYERAIELAPARASAYGGLGVVYRRLGRFEEAVAVYQQAIKASPARAWLHEELGRLYRDLNHLEEAAAEYERAVELAPTRASSYWGLGVTYEKLGRIEEAIVVYEEILRINPTSGGARQKLDQLSHIMEDVHHSLYK